jgi:hypothetical protein
VIHTLAEAVRDHRNGTDGGILGTTAGRGGRRPGGPTEIPAAADAQEVAEVTVDGDARKGEGLARGAVRVAYR